MAMNGPDDAVDDLAAVLFALDEGALSTAAVTARITSIVTDWALAKGWTVRREARVSVDDRPGFVDVVVGRGASGPHLAIEIDSTDKAWSVEKLRHAAAAGMHAIWIRWGDEEWAGTHADIDVIQLPARRQSASRTRPSSQLTLWP